VAFSADGKRAATGARDGSVRVFDLEKKGTLLPGGDWFLYEKGVGIGDLALNADGSLLAAGSDAGDVKVCRVAGKETLKTIKAHSTGIIACQISPDGKRIVTIGADNVVKLWDLDSGGERRSWIIRGQDRGKFISSVAFAADSKQLAIGNANTTVFILELPD
jgi:WD40 repeat protein